MQFYQALTVLFKRELLLAFRQFNEVLNSLLFFILVCSLFPLAMTPEATTLIAIGPGIIWVAALLATLLSLNRLFRVDYLDGSLEQLLLSPHPLSGLVLAKIIAHWLLTGLPLVIIAPVFALLLHLPNEVMKPLWLSLLLGTPLLSLIGAFGAALTVNLRNAGLLLALLIFPLYVPILIFGAGAVTGALAGLGYAGQLAWLAALLIGGITLLPIATAAALRMSIT
ncbi:MAG: heme exporter protein CcmB [Gammaproteobacteria bacterium]|jgi:heme exporter protein B|nr:heme exporter protein CcmB [Gammaproteobacteria bacterium]